MLSHSAMDKWHARRLPIEIDHPDRKDVCIAACCARRPEYKDAFRETEVLLATRRFPAAMWRATSPTDWVQHCKPRRRIRCGHTYQSDRADMRCQVEYSSAVRTMNPS